MLLLLGGGGGGVINTTCQAGKWEESIFISHRRSKEKAGERNWVGLMREREKWIGEISHVSGDVAVCRVWSTTAESQDGGRVNNAMGSI